MEIYPTVQTNRIIALPLIILPLLVSAPALSVTFDEIQAEIFTPTCAVSGCHANAQTPILSEGQSYANIVNVPSTQGLDYVEPGNPDQSYIVKKVEGTGVGVRMPFGQPALSASKIQLLRDWIEQGASSGSYLGRSYHMTASTSPNLSETHILNSSDSAQAFTGTLYHKSGLQLGDANVALHEGTINSQGRLILFSTDLETLFNVPPWTGPAIMDIQGSNQFDVMSKLTRNGRVTNTNCVRSGNAHNVEGADSSDVTYVRFINQGGTAISDIRGTLYGQNGDPVGETDVQFLAQLAPREAIFLTQPEISGIVGMTWDGEASLVLSENYENLRLMNLNFVNNETFFNFSCYMRGTDQNATPGTDGSPNIGNLTIY